LVCITAWILIKPQKIIVDFIQSFLAYLVCITAWILIKPQKIIVDIFTELLGFICAGELLTAYI